jgi:hypothetical protein
VSSRKLVINAAVGVFALLTLAFGSYAAWFLGRYALERQARLWPTTIGRIVAVRDGAGPEGSSHVNFYRYDVGGAGYRSGRYSCYETATDVRYSVGAAVVVRYDPRDPRYAILAFDPDVWWLLPVVLGAATLAVLGLVAWLRVRLDRMAIPMDGSGRKLFYSQM